MNKKPEQVTRLLAAPGNWTLDTLSDLLLAIGNFEPAFSVSSPLGAPARNMDTASLLNEKVERERDWISSQREDAPKQDEKQQEKESQLEVTLRKPPPRKDQAKSEIENLLAKRRESVPA